MLSKKGSGLTARFYSALYKKIQDPAIAVTHHQLMMFNLIYKAVKRDEEKVRVIAFIKRMLQLCLTYPPNLACSMLLIVSHILKERPQMLLNYPKEKKDTDDADPKENNRKYDSHTDNPLKAGAERTLCYELYALSKHYHPSVSLFATEILNNTDKGVEYFGDPLKDFSLMHFLDRFVYRNPKAQSHDVSSSQYYIYIYTIIVVVIIVVYFALHYGVVNRLRSISFVHSRPMTKFSEKLKSISLEASEACRSVRRRT